MKRTTTKMTKNTASAVAVKHPPRDALLKVIKNSKVQTKKLLNPHDLRKSGFVNPHVSHRPWGHERWLVLTKEYCMKELHLKKGAVLSIQSHPKKHETLVVASGKCRILLGKQGDLNIKNATCYTFNPGDVVRIEPDTVHTFQALTDALLFETSLPLPGEHHTVRHHDFYGRK
jgi:quercetin dioxygenase-like cupin family protein